MDLFVTPSTEVVLDSFCGSGSSLIACQLKGVGYIGIEINPEYCEIAKARLAYWARYPSYDAAMKAKPQGELFTNTNRA